MPKLVRDFQLRVAMSEDMSKFVLYNHVRRVELVFERDSTGYYWLTVHQLIQHVPPRVTTFHVRTPEIQVTNAMLTWHNRLGHAHFGTIKAMVKRGDIEDSFLNTNTKLNQKFDCVSCLVGKAKRMCFKTNPERNAAAFDKVYVDLGFVPTTSIMGSTCFLNIVDEATRFVWVFLLKEKSNTSNKLVEFARNIQLQFGKKIKNFLTDNGTEFVNKTMASYCVESGALHQATNIYTPEENSLVEKMNYVLMNKVRALLVATGFSYALWGDCLLYVVYSCNRTASVALGGSTPYECLYNTKPELESLLPWGCIVFAFVPAEKRNNKKLSPRAVPTVFLGYAQGQKGYRLLSLIDGTQLVARRENTKLFENFTVDGDFLTTLLKELVTASRAAKRSASPRLLERIPFRRLPVLQLSPNGVSVADENELQVLRQYCQELSLAVESMALDTPSVCENELEMRTAAQDGEEDDGNNDDSAVSFESGGEDLRPLKRVRLIQTFLETEIPTTWKQVCESAESNEWIAGAEREFDSLMKNETYVLVPRSEVGDQQVLRNKWVFRKKIDKDGRVIYKGRLVIKGFMQEYGVDYLETFAPVVRFESLRAVFVIAMVFGLRILQIDFDTAFLNATLPNQYKIFMNQPDGFVHPDYPDYVCQLQKSLYGLKQAPREWNNMFHLYMVQHEFKRNSKDYGVYWKFIGEEFLIVVIYVDDVLIIGPTHLCETFIEELKSEFSIKELGEVNKLLGMKVDYGLDKTILQQNAYVKKILEQFRMDQANPNRTPMELKLRLSKGDFEDHSLPYRSVVGCLQYLVTATRPDLAFATNFFSRFLNCYSRVHWNSLKRVLKYLVGTTTTGLVLDGVQARQQFNFEKQEFEIAVYTDADFNNEEDGKSITGFITLLNGQFVSAKSWKQKNVTESTSEAELVAANEGAKDGLWLKQLLESMEFKVKPILLYVDNKSTLEIAKHPTSHKRSKHLRLSLLKIREYVEDGLLTIQYVRSEENLADMFTKSLAFEKFQDFKMQLGLSVGICD